MATPEMIAAILSGSLMGLAAGEISRALAVRNRPPGRPDPLSWLLAGIGAVALATHPGVRSGPLPATAEAALITLLLLIVACDVRERAVYPAIDYPGVVLPVIAAPLLGTSAVDALLGAATSTGLFAAFYVVGHLRYGPGALGSGDVLVAAVLGGVAGLSGLSLALILVGVFAAGIASIVGLRARSLRATFPYTPALCLAALAATLLRAP
jgi:prepilin signal peptidase PulO-like enzyme (type II secretory pathway)